MLSRLLWNLLTLASLAVLGAVGYYFVREFRTVQERRTTVVDLRRLAQEEGPCAALMTATAVGTDVDFDLSRNVEVLREEFAGAILGKDDRKGQKALLSASREGLISPMVCEQIRMLADGGEIHPVLALLRFTREKDPCEEALALDRVIGGLGSHRSLLLRGLMDEPSRLRCLSPALSQEVAANVAAMAHDDPQAFDDLDVLGVANYLSSWAPMHASQIGCRVEATGDISRLANVIGCTPDAKNRVLTHYRYAHPIAGTAAAPALPAGAEVLLLWESADRCEVRPLQEPPRIVTVACKDLELLSGVDVAVLIEEVSYGAARVDMISGLVRYSGETKRIDPSDEEPAVKSWYGYDRSGESLGTTQVASLEELALVAGEELPENPLRSFCKQAGAEYCYDVDWTQLVATMRGDAVVYLSRPLPIFLEQASMPDEVAERLFKEAFGRAPQAEASLRIYRLSEGAQMMIEVCPGSLDVRWRWSEREPWRAQAFGSNEGGRVPAAARLVAAMDLEQDSRPELIVQLAKRVEAGGEVRDTSDEILLLRLEGAGNRFAPLTRLTVHEYRN